MSRLLKPRRIARRPGRSQAPALWRGCTALFPLHERTGAPRELFSGVEATTTTGAWVTTERAAAYHVAAGGQYLRFPARPTWQLNGDIDLSAVIVLDYQGRSGVNHGGILCVRNSGGSNGIWEIYEEDTGLLAFAARVGGVFQKVTFGAGPSAGWRVIGLTRRVGGGHEMWVDGVSRGTQTNTAVPNAVDHDLLIGALGPDATAHVLLGRYSYAAVWRGTALDGGQHQAIARDPFGWLRPRALWFGPTAAEFQVEEHAPDAILARTNLSADPVSYIQDDPSA